MPSLAFEPWGNYSLALAASVECLRVTPWTSTSTTPEILKLGVEASPEFSCLSFKATTGYFIKAAQEGVEYGVMVNSVGTCRLHYYRMLQQKILKDRGLSLFIFGLGYDGIKPPLIRHFDPDLLPFLQCSARARLKVLTIDALELAAWRTRAREAHKGDTTRVMNACLKDLDRSRTVREIRRFRKGISARFREIRVDADRVPLKVGLLGEATILRDRFLNQNIEEVLGSMGAEVRNFFLMGEEMRKIFHIGFFSKHSAWALRRLARPYLKSPVGGHAMESVANTIRCAREGYDGIVHVSPTGCMPEISVRPIIRKISQDMDIPVLEMSFDEHTSHVGIVTRLEAFVDIMQERRKKKRT
jgi:predicted nucleotide-binding protein (sugar kinase/HSP70/actin superfamily)